MTKHRSDLTKGSSFPSTWPNGLMEFVGTNASANFAVTMVPGSTTTVQVAAGTGNDQVAIAVMGRWRFITSTIGPFSTPGGSAATFDVFVTASDNDFSQADPADATNYAFSVLVLAQGQVPGTQLYRRVATMAWDGTRIARIAHLLATPPQNTLLHTSLPLNPSDGDVIDFQADASSGTIWRLRYRAGSASAWKWEFVGGPPLQGEVYNGASNFSQTYIDIPTYPGPSLTVPLAGEYLMLGAAQIASNGISKFQQGVVSIQIGATVPGQDPDQIASYGVTSDASGNTAIGYGARELRRTVTTANTVVKLVARVTSANSMTFGARSLSIRPVRVG